MVVTVRAVEPLCNVVKLVGASRGHDLHATDVVFTVCVKGTLDVRNKRPPVLELASRRNHAARTIAEGRSNLGGRGEF